MKKIFLRLNIWQIVRSQHVLSRHEKFNRISVPSFKALLSKSCLIHMIMFNSTTSQQIRRLHF